MYNPISTIRLQLNKNFTFRQLEDQIPFFIDLGIKTIYASPVFKAVPGSLHGYDVTDPLTINPEIGSEEDLIRISRKLSDSGIGWIQDIVPNHMAFHYDNLWLRDVLEKGPASEYAGFFDTTWSGDFFRDPIMVPFLGSSLKETIAKGELKISGSNFQYFDHLFPLNKQSKEFLEEIGEPNTDQIGHIANLQFYRLCSYEETNTKINFRRFFLINGLICLNIQSKPVFDKYHELIARLVKDGIFKGLRVDHIDGLYDPKEYLRCLRDLVGPEVFIVVEKILEPGEDLDQSWPIQGTTGYEFIAALNNLFTSTSAKRVFDELYRSVSPDRRSKTESKRLILKEYMGGELDNLTRYFIDLGLNGEDRAFDDVRKDIEDALVSCPYYRFYDPISANEEFELVDKKSNKKQAARFYARLNQYTGPLMAKGVEDTLMYTFNRSLAHNEVGDLPDQFGDRISAFHETMINRLKTWPYALNTTASHDTKRGEDSRMRLHVLTDIPEEWSDHVRKWKWINSKHNAGIDPNDEYMIYQALVGSFEDEVTDQYLERLSAYLSKALREAKVHSTWEAPNEKYEHSVVSFVQNILRDDEFMKSFLPFVRKVTGYGKINSFIQLVLKMTCPGVPDIYQGSLSWDLSFVDPDNRRPVDFSIRNDKVSLIKKLLHIRSDHEKVFSVGNYIPLKITGPLRSLVIAFAREYQGTQVVVAALLHSAQLQEREQPGDTTIQLPEHGDLSVSEVFEKEPYAIRVFEVRKRDRRAGILMPLTSLPSPFGIGDIGSSAKKFADFLFQSRQRAWQILPINAIDDASFYSPYSPISSVAGNTMLINVDGDFRNKSEVDYTAVGHKKRVLLRKAWSDFKERKPKYGYDEFQKFMEEESSWLTGFSQFVLLQKLNNNKPWPQWPEDVRLRDEKSLETLEREHTDEIMFIRWMQFIFFRQMKDLKDYCNERDIILIGDVPFYICLNSADVWQYRNVFDIDSSGKINNMAGVPPDYFNADGQMWGMPVFNWETESEAVLKWWTQRLKKNFKLVDYLRLDHFRAFAGYWSIPAGSETAKTGTWKKSPGKALFGAITGSAGDLKLIAEDLGDIGDDVYELRDTLGLPGMKVLQFAFGSDFPTSIHLPHNHKENFIVYPGTHDNNTTRGWFEHDIGPMEIKNLELYFGVRATKKNIADLFMRVCYSSTARTAIIPMQDILGLDQRSRINKPATTSGNWTWRLKELPNASVVNKLRNLVHLYER